MSERTVLVSKDDTVYTVTTYVTGNFYRLKKIGRICGGVDFGADLELIGLSGRFAVYKRPSGKGWAGYGRNRSFFPTAYMLIEFVEWRWPDGTPGSARFSFRILERVEPGRRWASERARLLAQAERLEMKRRTEGILREAEEREARS